eukprot:1334435-Amorphochlora_amoeboformis.AAC.1
MSPLLPKRTPVLLLPQPQKADEPKSEPKPWSGPQVLQLTSRKVDLKKTMRVVVFYGEEGVDAG